MKTLTSNYEDTYIHFRDRNANNNGAITFTLDTTQSYYFFVEGYGGYKDYNGSDPGMTFTPFDPIPDMELDPGTSVTAYVTLNGAPVQSACVHIGAETEWSPGSLYTDRDGKCTFTMLDADREYYFTVKKTSDHAAYHGKDLGKIFRSANDMQEIVLDPGARFTTKVTFNRVPQAGVLVELHETQYSGVLAREYTDSSGTVTFRGTPTLDSYFFAVWATAGDPYMNYHGKDLGETFGPADTVPEIRLHAGSSATTRVTLNGQPVAGATVSVVTYPAGNSTFGFQSDSQGYVTISQVPDNGEFYVFYTVLRGEGNYHQSDRFTDLSNPPLIAL